LINQVKYNNPTETTYNW